MIELNDAGGVARRLKIHVPDGWYPVMSRGNGGEVIYRTDEDRELRGLGTGRDDGGGDAASGLEVGGADAGGKCAAAA